MWILINDSFFLVINLDSCLKLADTHYKPDIVFLLHVYGGELLIFIHNQWAKNSLIGTKFSGLRSGLTRSVMTLFYIVLLIIYFLKCRAWWEHSIFYCCQQIHWDTVCCGVSRARTGDFTLHANCLIPFVLSYCVLDLKSPVVMHALTVVGCPYEKDIAQINNYPQGQWFKSERTWYVRPPRFRLVADYKCPWVVVVAIKLWPRM